MSIPKKKKGPVEKVQVVEINRDAVTLVLKGTTGLLMNRLSEKVKRELLLPSPAKTKGDKVTTLKHDPIAEFRASPYKSNDPSSPTLLTMPATSFKSALRNVAVDVPGGTSKAQLGRLTYVQGDCSLDYVSIYGVPLLKMDPVRQAGPARTPDIRTRACLREWVAIVTVVYVAPILSASSITTLMANAGIIQGVGDGRTEKGALSYGQWSLTSKKDPDVMRIMDIGDRAAQIAAMENPTFYDSETEELFSWFVDESERRGFRVVN